MLRIKVKDKIGPVLNQNINLISSTQLYDQLSISNFNLTNLDLITADTLPISLISNTPPLKSIIKTFEITNEVDFQNINLQEVQIQKEDTLSLLQGEFRKLLLKYSPIDVDDALQYFLLKGKIEFLTKAVEEYDKSKTIQAELATKKEAIQKKLTNIESAILSVDDIVKKKLEVMKKLSRLKITNSVLDLNQVKSSRSNFVVKKLKYWKKGLYNRSENKNAEELDFFVGEGLLILSFMQSLLLISLTLSVGFSFQVLLFSLIFIIINIFSTLYMNVVRFRSNYVDVYIEKSTDQFSYEKVIGKLDSNITNDIKSLSLVSAIKTEIKGLDQSISSQLDSKTLEQVTQEKIQLGEELRALSSNTNSQNMTQEEFYRSRRELDISKIELENLKRPDLSILEEDEQRLSILSQVYYNVEKLKNKYLLPIILILKSPLDQMKEQLQGFASINSDLQIIIVDNPSS